MVDEYLEAPIQPGFVKGETNAAYLVRTIKERLGYPTVQIEIKDGVIEKRLNDSLRKFVTVAQRPKKYYQISTNANQSLYRLPNDFMSMSTFGLYYLPDRIVDMVQSWTAYQMYVNFTGNLDVSYYETLMQHMQLRQNRIGARVTTEIVIENGITFLKVYPVPREANRYIVFQYVQVPSLVNWSPQTDPWGYDWVLDYAEALVKQVLGRVRGRFGGNVTAGDMAVTQDGEALITEGKEDAKRLEEELDKQRPVMPIIYF